MSEQQDGPGFTITLRTVYDEVKGLRNDLDARVRKIEIQISAQWVVIGIIAAGLGAAFGRYIVGA